LIYACVPCTDVDIGGATHPRVADPDGGQEHPDIRVGGEGEVSVGKEVGSNG
jgi:hypothetical protein